MVPISLSPSELSAITNPGTGTRSGIPRGFWRGGVRPRCEGGTLRQPDRLLELFQGAGCYRRTGFVHINVGTVRNW